MKCWGTIQAKAMKFLTSRAITQGTPCTNQSSYYLLRYKRIKLKWTLMKGCEVVVWNNLAQEVFSGYGNETSGSIRGRKIF
jgi:hypothetical protein